MNDSRHEIAKHGPQQLASEFLDAFRSSGVYLRENVARLASQAASENAEVAESASGAFFTSLVEPLADSFEPRAVTLYNRVFAQVIQACRATGRGRAIDSHLAGFGLRSEEDLIARAESLRLRPALDRLRERPSSVRRIILLSRVTLGADVAITSVIVERMRREFPAAEIALAGGRKAAELFGGDGLLSFKEVGYRRAGTVIERLLSWVDLLGVVRELTGGLSASEFLIVDPDTRLTQLGLLPLTGNDDQYLFFPSREYGGTTSEPLGQLTSAWLGDVFGSRQEIYPRLSLARADLDRAGDVVMRLRRASARPVVAINFGVGENPAKRVNDEFETSLVTRLISEGATVILDRGAGEDETRRCEAIIKCARESRNLRAVEFDERELANLLRGDSIDAELMVWSGRIGMLAALISKSDLYIGYDSAGQHIAAALGVPSIDVFAGFASARMLDRWRPTGIARSRVISARDADASALLTEALRVAREMLEGGRR
ncbi:MAG TPA: glycosyltransferase family 9 protein [Blastocatellia bacterium]|nr:glycosyltransferase family 9 protein [Blastocatellia bacterium]